MRLSTSRQDIKHNRGSPHITLDLRAISISTRWITNNGTTLQSTKSRYKVDNLFEEWVKSLAFERRIEGHGQVKLGVWVKDWLNFVQEISLSL